MKNTRCFLSPALITGLSWLGVVGTALPVVLVLSFCFIFAVILTQFESHLQSRNAKLSGVAALFLA